MIYLSTTRPCVASGDPSYRWETPDDVVAVDPVTAAELLALKDAGFHEVAAPEADDSEPEAEPSEPEEAPAEPAKRRGGRPRKAVAEAPAEDVQQPEES